MWLFQKPNHHPMTSDIMYKFLLSILLIICVFATFVFSEEEGKTSSVNQKSNAIDKKLHKRCIYPTVMITGNYAGGSGVIVRSTQVNDKWHNTIVSAAHVVINDDLLCVQIAEYKNWSEIKSYKKYNLVIYAVDVGRDLAVAYFVSDEEMPVAKFCFNPKLYINTKVFHCGYALFDDVKIDYGRVTQPKVINVFPGMIRTNCFTLFGDSGGPLFLEDNYKLIGICCGIRSHSNKDIFNMSYYRSISDLKVWDLELNKALESVYTESVDLPLLPFVKLKLKDYQYQLPE